MFRCRDSSRSPFLAVRLRSERDGRISTSVRRIGDEWIAGRMNGVMGSAVNVLMTSRSYLVWGSSVFYHS